VPAALKMRTLCATGNRGRRATQTDEKLRREGVSEKAVANAAHREVGKKVRQTIKELGGTMPEDFPTPEKSIKQLDREQNKQLNMKETK